MLQMCHSFRLYRLYHSYKEMFRLCRIFHLCHLYEVERDIGEGFVWLRVNSSNLAAIIA